MRWRNLSCACLVLRGWRWDSRGALRRLAPRQACPKCGTRRKYETQTLERQPWAYRPYTLNPEP